MRSIPVLVLNWNGRAWLERCFAALGDQVGARAQPWLVDAGSSDDSLEVARRLPGVRSLALGANRGFGAAYNRAIRAVDAPLIALLNNDAIVEPDWLAALVGAMEPQLDTAAIGSKLLFLDRPRIVNHAGGRLTPFGAAYDVGFGAPDGSAYSAPGLTGCATGAAMLLRRDAFLSIGGFDERYFAYFEDADLCWRFWLHGYSVRFEPGARALHAYGGSTGDGRANPFRIEHCQTNRLQNMAKNLEAGSLLSALPASIGYDAMRLASTIRSGHRAATRALTRGTARFVRLLPAVLRERARVQSARVRSDEELRRLGVIAGLCEAASEWRRLAAGQSRA